MKLKNIFILLSALFVLPAFVTPLLADENAAAEAAVETQDVVVVYNGSVTVVFDRAGTIIAVLEGNPMNLTANIPMPSTAVVTAAVVAPTGVVITPPSVSVAPIPANTAPVALAPAAVQVFVQAAAAIPTTAAAPATAVVATVAAPAPATAPAPTVAPPVAPAPVPVTEVDVVGSPNVPRQ